MDHEPRTATIERTPTPVRERTRQATLRLERRGDRWHAAGTSSALLGRRYIGAGSPDEGCWAEWMWDGAKLHVRTDRFGFYPVFRYAGRDRYGLSTSILDLLRFGAPTELDDDALAVFLRLGCFVGDDTPFASIRAVPPGSDVAGAPEAVRWPNHVDRVAAVDVSRDRAKRWYGELFQDAVERLPLRPDDRVGVPLSGGRDSRHILLALARANRLPDCCITMRHHPPKPNEDAEIAARVAAAVDVPHIALDPPSRMLRAEQEKNLLTSLCALDHAWILPLAEYVRAKNFTVLLDGIAGDVLSAGLFLSEDRLRLYQAGELRELAERLLGDEGYLPNMLPAHLYRRWNRERAVRRVETELERHLDAQNPVAQFYFWNRTRRQIALSPWSLLSRHADVLAPFLEHRVYDFLAGLPASFFLDRTFHTETIRESYPEFGAIPFETGSPMLPAPRSGVAATAWSAAALAVSSQTDTSYVRRSFLLPRLAKGLASRRYGSCLRRLMKRPIYLFQLAAARNGASLDA